MLSDLGTTARGHSQDRSSHHHSHTSDNIEIWGRGAGNEQVTEFGDVCSICKPSWGGANYCPTPVWFSFFLFCFRVLSFVSLLFGFHDGVEGKSLPEDLKIICKFRRGLYT